MRMHKVITLLFVLITGQCILLTTAYAAQYARPASNFSPGSWTATGAPTIWEATDETTANGNTDYTSVTAAASVTPLPFEVGLSNISDPGVDTGHIIRFSAMASNTVAPADETLTVELYEGTTLIASTGVNTLGAAYATFTYTVPNAVITDYTNLSFRVTANNLRKSGSTSDVAYVTWLELETPDPPLNTPPSVPANPLQYQSNGTTSISVGGYATSTTVVFEGDLADPDADTVKLQIDYTGDNTSDCESALVASGTVNVQASCGGLVDGNSYNWQYRAIDSKGASSAWTAFNAANPDFRVDATKPTVASTVPTNGATGVALNSQVTINFSENVNCSTVTAANITSTSPGWAFSSCSGSQAIFTTSGQVNTTTYNFNVTIAVTDLAGNALNAAYPFSYTTVAAANNPPSAPANPGQYQSDGTTAIVLGGYATSTTVVLKADLSDPDADTVKLQIDYTGDSSSDCESALVASGSTAVQVSCSGLTDGNSYNWQYRAVDSKGAAGSWTAYAGTPDFIVDATKPTVTSTSPSNGATDIALNSQVTIHFSENIDCATVNTTTVTSTSPGWTLGSCAGVTAVFNTSGQANSTSYSVNVSTGVKDPAGNAMNAAYPFSYTTAAAGADAIFPKVISFAATSPLVSNVNIPVTVFTATDNIGVAGFMITASATQPGAGDAGWTGTAPTTFTAAAGDGTKTLYPWVKDAAGNVSALFASPASVVVDGTAPTDGTLTVTAGDTLNSLSWTAASDAGVGLRATGRYMVRFAAGATAPADCASGTQLSSGNNLTYTHTGLTNTSQYSYRVCAYDALGNVSAGKTGSGTPAVANTPTLSNTTVKWLTSGKVSSAKTTTANLGATINAAGTSAITARGIVWSATNTNPTLGGGDVHTIVATGTTIGSYSAVVPVGDPLPIASQIYFQGYATNGSGTSYSGVISFWTEPATAAAPTVNPLIPGENYFDLTVNYDAKPANADGMLLVVRQSYAPKTAPYDGTTYTSNPRIGSGSPTDPNCLFYCEYVVADITDPTPGSVAVTGLKAGLNHYFSLYAYKGSGPGLSGINYVQTINSVLQATAPLPLAGRSHNELWVATSSPKDGVDWGTMTSADCANCHGTHHTSQLLPTGVDMYDKCYTCHQDGGAADDNTADAKINMALHLSDGSVDCGTCHSMHSFKNEELYSTDHAGTKGFNRAFVRANMAKHFNTSNGFATNALEPTVFQNRPTDFANTDGDTPYNAVCQTCHTDASRTPYHQQTGTTGHNIATDCMSCHTHRNAAGKTGAFTPGGHDATHFPWNATTQASCGTVGCHNATANPDVVMDVHGGTCSACHSNPSGGDGMAKIGDAAFGVDGSALLADPVDHTTPALNSCLICHPAATYDHSAIHHTSKNGYATVGNCTQCHSGTNYPGDHSARVSLAANCADCHTGTQGSVSGIPVDATDATVAARKIHDACTTCHNSDGDATLKAPYGAAQAMPGSGTPSNDGGGSCEACHTSGFGGYHATVGHATTVNTYVNCSTCHTATAGLIDSMPTSVVDNKVHDACATCHGADGRLVGAATGKNGGTNGGSDALNNCATCHGEYFNSHTNINHTTRVAVGGICGDCHAATAGTTTTVPVDGANNKKHDACATCHQATGVLKTFAQADTHNPDWITAMPAGGGTCLTCHGDNFTTKTHSASHAAEFYYDTVGTGAALDILQNNGSAGCAACHNDAGASLATFAAIYQEHLNDCNKCHAETRDTNESAATGTTVRQWIAAREADTADTNCRTCHVPNWTNVPNHAGHNTSDFAWDAATQNSCGTVGCHDYVANPDVVADIHGGTCTICHSSSSGGDGTAKIGSATNGVDGDATLGSTTTPHTDNCLVCHNIADADVNAASIGGIHHDNKGDAGLVVEGDCTTRCHTVTGFKGTHDATVATTTNCSSCHTATAGDPTGGVPVNAANGKVHDGCMTCHGITAIPAADGYLLAAYGKASAMPAGGGDCNACHGAYFTSHVNANHTVHIGDTTNCNTCHTATAGTTTTAPVNSGDNKVHDACASCHNTTNGSLLAVTAPGGSANIASGDCNACHGAYFPSHGNANHSTFVSLATNCADCHNGTQGTATTIPVNTGNNKVHDACADCHNTTTGALLAPYGAAQAIPAGGGSCETCHTAGFTGYHGTVSHATMVAAYVNCSTCHTATGNTVNPSDPKVHDACASCHGADGRLIGSATGKNGGDNGGTNGGGNCSVCHGEYFNSHTNANHNALVAGLATCTTCHTGTAGTSTTVPISNVDHKLHDSCSTCHQATGALVTFPTANGWTTAMPDGGAGSNNGGGDCGACHGAAYFDSHVHGRDTAGYVTHDLTHNITTDLSQDPGQPCRNCHNGNNADGDGTALNSWRDIKSEHLGSCAICHSYTNADGQGTPPLATNNTVIASGTSNKCLSCHTPKAAPNKHGGHSATDFAWTTTTKTTCGTAACHDWANNVDVVATIHNGTCLNCHSTSSGGDGTAVAREVGDATKGSTATPHTDACTVCHTLPKPAIHHQKTGGPAALGNCHQCHPDPRTDGIGTENIPYSQLACRLCHVKAYGSGIEVADIILKGGTITGANGTMTGNLQNTIASNPHQFPKTISINNYGACFHCHGQTGVAAGRATKTVKPMHALPTPTIARTNLGTENVLDINQIGGGGYLVNNTISPNVFPATEFKGGRPTGYPKMWNTAYAPMGKERLNIGWTLHSQSKKAANIGTTKDNTNQGLITASIFNIPAGLNYGTATLPHDSNARHFFPHFDATPGTLGVDTLSGTANAVWSLAAGGTGPIAATRSISVNVTSSDLTSTLSVIYGGRVVWTGTANGRANTSIDIGALAASLVPAGHQHVYASAGTGVVFVVSNRGGSIKLRTATNPGQGVN